MAHTFDTRAAALTAGYDSPTAHVNYRGYEIVVSDVSGGNWFGYAFAVNAIPCAELIRQGHEILGPFGESVTVSLRNERNKAGKVGAFTVMFAPGTLSAAINEAKTAIDRACD